VGIGEPRLDSSGRGIEGGNPALLGHGQPKQAAIVLHSGDGDLLQLLRHGFKL